MWLADNVKISNDSNYVIGSNFLRILGGFEEGCVVYTCRAKFTSRTVSLSTEICAGSKLIFNLAFSDSP